MVRPIYSIRIDGVDAEDLSAGLLRDLCDILIEGASRAARLSLEGRSTAPGVRSAELAALSDVRIAAYRPGSLDLAVSAPTFREAQPELGAQQRLFTDDALDPESTALDFFLQAVEDASHGRHDSNRLDAGMMEIMGRFRGLFAAGATAVCFSGRGRIVPVSVAGADEMKRLRDQTPTPRTERITGVLDSVTLSTRSFVLRVTHDASIRGLALNLPAESLGPMLGRQVVVEGMVAYKPSGAPLRIDAEAIVEATAADALWARVPRADALARTSLVPVADLALVFGKWPGDESDEQVFAALEAIS